MVQKAVFELICLLQRSSKTSKGVAYALSENNCCMGDIHLMPRRTDWLDGAQKPSWSSCLTTKNALQQP